jgi:hypothetical protein
MLLFFPVEGFFLATEDGDGLDGAIDSPDDDEAVVFKVPSFAVFFGSPSVPSFVAPDAFRGGESPLLLLLWLD